MPVISEPRVPQIIAHRGYSAKYPEQTPVAFEEALKLPIYGIECDVQGTKDGHLAVIHDDVVDRVSNGTGAVADLTVSELLELNFGTTDNPQHIMVLEELLEMLEDYPDKSLLLETKHPSRFGGQIEHKVSEILTEKGLAADPRINIISFDKTALDRAAELLPDLDRCLLLNPHRSFSELVSEAGQTPTILGPEVSWARQYPDVIGWQALNTYVWTVDDVEDLRWCRENQVPFLGTNDPEVALQVFSNQ